MEYSVNATAKRSTVSSWRDSMRHSVFRTRCQTSMVHLRVPMYLFDHIVHAKCRYCCQR